MTNRAPRPWDPTPGEAAVTRTLVSMLEQVDGSLAVLQSVRSRLVEMLSGIALAQRERYERIPVGETRDGQSIFDPDDMPVRAMIAEVSAATRKSRRAVAVEFDEAWLLGNRFPAVRAAFERGEVDEARAAVLVGEGSRLSDDDMRAHFERLALPHAAEKTVYGTREAARRIAAMLEPEPFHERHEKARRQRGVFVRDLDDGMAELCLVADAPFVNGAHDRLTQMARKVTAARSTEDGAMTVEDDAAVTEDDTAVADERTFAQVRADLAVDLLLAGRPDAHRIFDPTGMSALDTVRARVQVTVPVATLAGLDEEPVDLAGYGPVAAEFARRTAADAPHWIRLFHAPDTGALRTVDSYKPTAAQRRFLRSRDEKCGFPHCERRAPGADIDHVHDHALGGITDVTNMVHLCRHHHVTKHQSAWMPTLHPDGEVTWVSPAGIAHTSRPASAVRFVDAERAAAARATRAAGSRVAARSGPGGIRPGPDRARPAPDDAGRPDRGATAPGDSGRTEGNSPTGRNGRTERTGRTGRKRTTGTGDPRWQAAAAGDASDAAAAPF